MASKWQKIRRLHEIDCIRELDYHLPQVPQFLPLGSNAWRMLFSVRNTHNRPEILSVDICLVDETEFKVDADSIRPFLPNLVRSDFDKDSCFNGDYAMIDGKHYLFYTGGICIEEPPLFEGRIGCLELSDEMRVSSDQSNGKIALDIDVADPHALMTPSIHSNGSRYLMWYASTQYFQKEIITTLEHNYHIRCAVSRDGFNWRKLPKPSIDFDGSDEAGITRPWITESDGFYEMWYSRRGKFSKKDPTLRRYKIGYATSQDGIDWIRRDDEHHFLGNGEGSGWDCEMQCYATVLKTDRGDQFMFYCGNGYGERGIGYAMRVDGENAGTSVESTT